jgi:hypothetical protein
MSRHRLKQINKDRSKQSQVRRARMQQLSAMGKSVTTIAQIEGVAVQTVHNNLSLARKEATPMANEIRVEADAVLRDLLTFIKSSEEMTDAEIVREIRATWKDLRDLHGADAPSKSIVGHISGPQLDSLYLAIRQELLDLSDGDKQEALLLLRQFAKSRTKPVVVDAMPLQPVERSLTDGYFS